MDGPVGPLDPSDLDNLTVKDKQELRQFIANEQQRINIQQRMRALAHPPTSHAFQSPSMVATNITFAGSHDLTQMCWTKCVTGSIKSNVLDKSEQTCLANCVERFLDVGNLAVKHLQARALREEQA